MGAADSWELVSKKHLGILTASVCLFFIFRISYFVSCQSKYNLWWMSDGVIIRYNLSYKTLGVACADQKNGFARDATDPHDFPTPILYWVLLRASSMLHQSCIISTWGAIFAVRVSPHYRSLIGKNSAGCFGGFIYSRRIEHSPKCTRSINGSSFTIWKLIV